MAVEASLLASAQDQDLIQSKINVSYTVAPERDYKYHIVQFTQSRRVRFAPVEGTHQVDVDQQRPRKEPLSEEEAISESWELAFLILAGINFFKLCPS